MAGVGEALAEVLRPRLRGRQLLCTNSKIIGVWIGGEYLAVLELDGSTVSVRRAYFWGSRDGWVDLSDPGSVDCLVAEVNRLAPSLGRRLCNFIDFTVLFLGLR